VEQISQNGKKKTKINIFQGSVATVGYVGEVDMSIIVVLQITSVYCLPNIIEIG